MGRVGRKKAAIAAVAVVAAAIVAATAWTAVGSPPAATMFALEIDGQGVALARAYELKGTTETPARKLYTVRLERGLSNDTSLAAAFEQTTTFATATIKVLDPAFDVIATYTLSDVSVQSFEHTGSSATPLLLEEVVLTGRSLSISTP